MFVSDLVSLELWWHFEDGHTKNWKENKSLAISGIEERENERERDRERERERFRFVIFVVLLHLTKTKKKKKPERKVLR